MKAPDMTLNSGRYATAPMRIMVNHDNPEIRLNYTSLSGRAI